MKFLWWMVVPLCKHCVHYIPSPHGKFDDPSSKCKKIGTVDVVNGVIEYSSTQSVREYACGEQGMLYQPDPRFYIKRMRHYLRPNWRMLGYVLLLLFFI